MALTNKPPKQIFLGPAGPVEYQPKSNDEYVYAICEVPGDYFNEESWPTRFQGMPREGDFVESENGSILKIIRVIHTRLESGQPVIRLELARDVSSQDGVGF